MGILSVRIDGTRTTRCAWIAVLVTGAGCAVFEALDGPEQGAGSDFPHRVHVVDEGLDCVACHPGAEDQDEPGMPVPAQCMLCHEASEEGTAPEERIERFFDGEQLLAVHSGALPEETIFPHGRHVTAGLLCTACHGDVGESERITPAATPSMDDCMQCHAERSVSNECSTCHQVIRRDSPPSTHAHSWLTTHGQDVRADRGLTVDRCTLCHQESSCTACHQEMPPQSHTNYWRRRGHSLGAQVDRDSCAACHRPDYCARCHMDSRPMSHVGPWGGTTNTHCFSCHLPLQDNGCAVCHQDTPSHLLAAPKPPDHVPGMNCRQCHGISAPLPHVDNGDDCNICHR